MKKHNIFTLVMLLAFVTLFLVGCSTTQPMTPTLAADASQVGEVEEFQYYVSTNILLRRTDTSKATGGIDGSGRIDIQKTRRTFEILSSQEGELLRKVRNEKLGATYYYIAFEETNDNTLTFVHYDDWGPGEKFFLEYDDNDAKTVNYGGVMYVVDSGVSANIISNLNNLVEKAAGTVKGVTYDDGTHPHLLVKMDKVVTERDVYERASGRKVKSKK
ncbi:MAG: hypothetical protein FWG13_06110 [Leptospirales bacterium]|nr:hypothetical protein [Leptospirales bacterium]